jgi:prevent-host-death family protein
LSAGSGWDESVQAGLDCCQLLSNIVTNLVWKEGMKAYNADTAKTQLSKLIEQACVGEVVVIARNNVPVVKLVPVQPQPKRQRGSLKGQVVVHESFFDPLSDEEMEAWGLR